MFNYAMALLKCFVILNPKCRYRYRPPPANILSRHPRLDHLLLPPVQSGVVPARALSGRNLCFWVLWQFKFDFDHNLSLSFITNQFFGFGAVLLLFELSQFERLGFAIWFYSFVPNWVYFSVLLDRAIWLIWQPVNRCDVLRVAFSDSRDVFFNSFVLEFSSSHN